MHCITKDDPNYPKQLHQLHDPPEKLYVRGTLPHENMISIVGPRKNSIYGRQLCKDITKKIVQHGATIVSGLAFGIDSIAHQATLEHNGATIAVLGSGIDDDSISPRQHLSLAHKILNSGGAIISEYKPGTHATKYSFPARNRIIAALSSSTIVIEAAKKSGALITAEHAMDLGKDVYAIPQNIYAKNAFGTNKLLESGAQLISEIDSLPDRLGLPKLEDHVKKSLLLTPPEKFIYSILTFEPIHIDDILKRTDDSKTLQILSQLEIRGIIHNVGNMHYAKLF